MLPKRAAKTSEISKAYHFHKYHPANPITNMIGQIMHPIALAPRLL
jgi:hypothetical protein